MSRVIQASAAVAALVVSQGVRAEPATALVQCRALDNGKAASAEIAGPDGEFRSCTEGVTLPEGMSHVRVRLRGTLLGTTQERAVAVQAGHSTVLEVAFETGELMLWAVSGSQPAAAEADVWHDGRVAGRLQQGRAVRVGIGTYVVEARAGNASERFGAVHVGPGGRTVLFWQTGR